MHFGPSSKVIDIKDGEIAHDLSKEKEKDMSIIKKEPEKEIEQKVSRGLSISMLGSAALALALGLIIGVSKIRKIIK